MALQWSDHDMERVSWLTAKLAALKEELRRDKEYLSEEADRWREKVYPELIRHARAGTVEAEIRSHLHDFERLRREADNVGVTEFPTLKSLLADCDTLATEISSCDLVVLPPDSALAGPDEWASFLDQGTSL